MDNTITPYVESRAEIMPISAADAKAWEAVTTVLTWMRQEQSYNYSAAFEATGVPRATFYRAIKRPYIQGKLLERLQQQDAAELEILDASMWRILRYQALLACGEEGSPRESTAAARFCSEREAILRERLERSQGDEEGKSEASVILSRFKERFGDGSTVRARRTTTVEEVEVG
jgi:hypothetical protein